MGLRSFRLAVIVLSAAAGLGACSGPVGGNNGGGGGGNAGTTRLVLTMTDAPPSGVSLLASPVSIGSLVLDADILGATRPVPDGTILANVDLVRLQSDSAFVGSFNVQDLTYKRIIATIGMPNLSYLNQTGAAVTEDALGNKCANNSICVTSTNSGFFGGQFSFATGGALPATFAGGTLTASFDLNQSSFVTSAPGFLTLDFSQTGALSLISLPHTGAPSGSLEFVEDFLGTVTAVSGNTVTIQPAGVAIFGTPVPLVATANSSTKFDNCATATIACVHTNQSLSVDALVNGDGTVTLLEVDDLADTTGDELEGTVASIDSTHQVFVIMVADKLKATNSTNTTFQTQIDLGQPVQVAVNSGATFKVDTKGLPVPTANLGTFTDFSSLVPGQTVRISVSGMGTNTSGSPYLQVDASSVTLRFTRLTGHPNNVASPTFNFDATTLPPFFGLVGSPQVQTFGGVTRFDGVTDLTGVASGDTVSIRALFLPKSTPAFFAAKVRKH